MKRVYMYAFHERMWHWVQALLMISLMVSGLVIHLPTRFPVLSFEVATRMHEWIGVLLSVNAALGLTYHVFSQQFSQYLPQGRSFMGLAVRQVVYYAWGIFRGAPHPMEKTADHKLNPLQQLTYLAILNVLLPLQILTGMVILIGRYRPGLAAALGDLGVLAPLHMLGAWGFVAFLIGHVYLTTTGHTPLSSILAMITGWEEVDEHGEGGHP